MPTNTLKKLLDLKVWQSLAPAPVASAANMLVVDSNGPDQSMYYITSTTAVWVYDPNEDGWTLLPSPALATFAAGVAAKWHPSGPTGTALAGSTSTTLNTATTVLGSLKTRSGLYFKVRITGGTGAGQERNIVSHTYGANSVITVDTAWSVTPDATSTYTLYSGRLYVFGGGTLAAGSFKYWDHATQTWSGNLVITGLPATFGTDGRMVCPNSVTSATKFTGTATGGSATTLVNSAKSWTTNQFANWQVRITAGTGAGGIRAITSNTATTLTIASGTALDATSQYVIEPSDDFIYLLGNNAVTLYRYQISTTTWTTLSPTAARAAAPGAGASGHWIHGVTQAPWTTENTVINGNRIYSFRGGASNVLDYYDIAANTWVSGVTYARQNETFTTGVGYAYDGTDYLYIQQAQLAAGPTRIVKLDLRGPSLEAFSTNPFPAPAAAVLGDKVAMASYGDGTGSPLNFLYVLQPGGIPFHRCLVW